MARKVIKEAKRKMTDRSALKELTKLYKLSGKIEKQMNKLHQRLSPEAAAEFLIALRPPTTTITEYTHRAPVKLSKKQQKEIDATVKRLEVKVAPAVKKLTKNANKRNVAVTGESKAVEYKWSNDSLKDGNKRMYKRTFK